jgi:PEP-CTERM motif
MFRFKGFLFALLFLVMYFGAASQALADTVTFTLPDFNGQFINEGTFPRPPLTVATLNFPLPVGSQIDSAQFSGTFGSGIKSTSAPGTLKSDGLILTLTSIPEPTTLVLLGSGLAAFGLRRRISK